MGHPRSVALASLVLMLMTACTSDGGDTAGTPRDPVATPAADDSRIIGLIGATSGRDAWLGEDAFEGANLAVSEINRSLDEGEADFELITLDDEGEADRAAELIDTLTLSQRTVGIVYAGPAEALADSESALQEAGIPAILIRGDLYSARRLSPHVFQSSPPYSWQARRLARYLVQDRRYKTIGALVGTGHEGATARTALRDELRRAGGRLAASARYDTEDPDVEAALERLRAAGAEAVVVQGDSALFDGVLRTTDRWGAGYRGASAARIASAKKATRRLRKGNYWHPQLVGFDSVIGPRHVIEPPVGTIATDSYARGTGLLPVPSLQSFESAFRDWWGEPTNGWEQRSYEAVHLLAWAERRAQRTSDGESDRARMLEDMDGRRFGGLDVTFGPDDHTTLEESWIGLWTTPASWDRVDGTDSLPWVPLARGFSIDGRRTDIPAKDWRHLFRNPPPRRAPAPPFKRMKLAVTAPRSSDIH